MSVLLRDYQQNGVEAIRAAFRAGRKAVGYIAPTGSGKGVVMAYIAQGATTKGNRITILVHRQELMRQTAAALASMGVEFGVMAAGHDSHYCPVQLGMVASMASRMDRYQPPNLLMIDECHHLSASSYQAILAKWKFAKVLGLTATPQRLDGKGLGGTLEELILGPTVQDLIDRGFLARPIYFAPPVGLDMTGVRRTAGDFNRAQTAERVDRPKITGSAVEHYARICPGKPAVAFCASIAHSEHVRDQFTAAGFPAASIDGTLGDEERIDRVAALADGRIKVLTSVDVISEGFDLPIVSAAILLRPTESLALHLQQVGRTLRPDPAKTCIASGSRILTQRGLVNIEHILPCDLIWDGHDFVSHGGLLNQGVRNVITYEGLTATPDHLVKTQQGWRSFGECADKQIKLVTTGRGRTPIRERQDRLRQDHTARGSVEDSYIRRLPMRYLQSEVLDNVEQSVRGTNPGLSPMQPAGSFSEVALSSVPINAGQMYEKESPGLQGLRSAGNTVLVSRSFARSSVDCAQYGTAYARTSDRQGRKRRPLCSGKPSVVNPAPEHESHETQQTFRSVQSFQITPSGDTVCRLNPTQYVLRGADRCPDNSKGVQPIGPTATQVWDIYRCGPRNSFTVEGKLVHNCSFILDHVGNCLRHGLAEEAREWSLAGIPTKKRDGKNSQVELLTCSKCFGVHPPAPCCPNCGEVYPVKTRSVAEVDGTLSQLTAAAILAERDRIQQRQAVGRAKTYGELQAIAKARGYSAKWAGMMMAIRVKRNQFAAKADAPTLAL